MIDALDETDRACLRRRRRPSIPCRRLAARPTAMRAVAIDAAARRSSVAGRAAIAASTFMTRGIADMAVAHAERLLRRFHEAVHVSTLSGRRVRRRRSKIARIISDDDALRRRRQVVDRAQAERSTSAGRGGRAADARSSSVSGLPSRRDRLPSRARPRRRRNRRARLRELASVAASAGRRISEPAARRIAVDEEASRAKPGTLSVRRASPRSVAAWLRVTAIPFGAYQTASSSKRASGKRPPRLRAESSACAQPESCRRRCWRRAVRATESRRAAGRDRNAARRPARAGRSASMPTERLARVVTSQKPSPPMPFMCG